MDGDLYIDKTTALNWDCVPIILLIFVARQPIAGVTNESEKVTAIRKKVFIYGMRKYVIGTTKKLSGLWNAPEL